MPNSCRFWTSRFRVCLIGCMLGHVSPKFKRGCLSRLFGLWLAFYSSIKRYLRNKCRQFDLPSHWFIVTVGVAGTVEQWQHSTGFLLWSTLVIMVVTRGEGEGFSVKFYTGVSTPKSFYISFLTEKVLLSYTFYWQMVLLSQS